MIRVMYLISSLELGKLRGFVCFELYQLDANETTLPKTHTEGNN